MRNLIVCTHQILLARSNQEHATLVEENSYSGLVFQLKIEKFNCPINLLHRSAQLPSHYLPNDKKTFHILKCCVHNMPTEYDVSHATEIIFRMIF
jgi:hypothetical protein